MCFKYLFKLWFYMVYGMFWCTFLKKLFSLLALLYKYMYNMLVDGLFLCIGL